MKLKFPKDVKVAIIKIFEGVAQRLTVVQDRVKAATITKDAHLSTELGAWVRGAGQSLVGMVQKYPSATLKELKLELGEEVKFDDIEKKSFEMSTEVQAALTTVLDKSQETVASLLTKVQEADETEDKMDTPMPDEVAKTIQELATGLKETHDKNSKPAEKKEEKEVRQVEVDKAGRPLSKDKVKVLSDTKDMLERLLASVTGDSKKSLPLGQTQDLKSATDPNHANQGSGNQPSMKDVMTALEAFKDVPGMADIMKDLALKVKAGESPVTAELQKKLDTIQAELKTSQETVASQETTIEKQVQKLKEVPGGNSESETPGSEIEKNDDLVLVSPWSGDMAKPDDRESVEKRGDVYFGPEETE